jgi:hypothetical protein
MKEEKLSKQEIDVLKRLAQVTYDATIMAAKKYEEISQQKTALRLAKKSTKMSKNS